MEVGEQNVLLYPAIQLPILRLSFPSPITQESRYYSSNFTPIRKTFTMENCSFHIISFRDYTTIFPNCPIYKCLFQCSPSIPDKLSMDERKECDLMLKCVRCKICERLLNITYFKELKVISTSLLFGVLPSIKFGILLLSYTYQFPLFVFFCKSVERSV